MWFQPVPQGDMAADLQVQTYDGQHVLTWWQGYSGAGVGAGEDVIENSARTAKSQSCTPPTACSPICTSSG